MPGVLHALRQQGFTCWDPSSTEDPLQPGPEDSRPVYKPFETPPSRTQQIEVLPGSPPARPLFNYFLDGSMRTTSAGHVVDTTGRFLPIFISQIGVAATKLRGGSLHLEQYRCRNVLFLPDTFASADINASRPAIHRATQDHRHPLDLELECYAVDEEVPPIEGARKHVLGVMHQMEIDCIADLAKSGKITRDALLMIDGSLQFYEDLSVHKEAFRNVVGVAKSFDLHQVLGRRRRSRTMVGSLVAGLRPQHRTPARRVPHRNLTIGAWYLRLHSARSHAGLTSTDGVVKLEVFPDEPMGATPTLDANRCNRISSDLLHLRHPTTPWTDGRWASHLYPIHLTERYIKTRFRADHTIRAYL